ncbi:MAG: peptide deformylase [Bacteriovoracaceae bacterium]|nr:peptide deformylase [Bacteriovoracaceae bacterium]
MAIRDVIRMGNPILRKVAEVVPVDEITSDAMKELVQDMFETMNAEQGIGIAAPQIGVSKQVAIITIPSEEGKEDPDSSPVIVVFNPKISVIDEELQGFWEGCLSVPGLRGFVERPRKVLIEYYDHQANQQKIEVEDFLATVFQHELDHLFGQLYVDRIKDITKLSYNEEFQEFHTED